MSVDVAVTEAAAAPNERSVGDEGGVLLGESLELLHRVGSGGLDIAVDLAQSGAAVQRAVGVERLPGSERGIGDEGARLAGGGELAEQDQALDAAAHDHHVDRCRNCGIGHDAPLRSPEPSAQ